MVIFGLFTATVVARSASACNRACCPLMSEALPHASPRFFIMAFPRQLSGSHANDAAHSLTRPTRSHHQIRGRSIGRSAAASNLRKRNNVMLSSHHYSARSLARVCGQPGGVQPALRGLGSFAARNRGRTDADGGTEGGADGGPSDANNLNQHHPISLKLMIVRGSCVRRSVGRSVGRPP